MNYIQGFVADCQARGLTKHTIETYRSNIRAFLKAYPEPGSVSLDDLRTFLSSLRQHGYQGSTLRGYFASISALFDYLVFEERHGVNLVPGFRRRYLARIKPQQNGENTRQLISVQDARLMLQLAKHVQKRAIVLTFTKTGVRLGEFLAMREDDLDFRTHIIRIAPKAKRSNRIIFMDDELEAVLRQYFTWRKFRARSSWLWVGIRGGKIRKEYPGQVFAELGETLHLHDPRGALCRRLTPHCMRHFFTTNLRRAGMNPEIIKWLRGDSLHAEAWQIYDHIDTEEARTEYLRCIPRLLPEANPERQANRAQIAV